MPITILSQQRDLDAAFTRAGTDRLLVLYATAAWCGPCRAISPRYDSWSDEYRQAVFTKFDVDAAKPLAQAYRITAMPTFIFIKNRQTLETVKGANPAAIEAAIRKHAGPPQRNYVEGSGSAPIEKALQGHTSLLSQIDTSQTTCLNESSSHTLKSLLQSSSSSSPSSSVYLESDADEQLLLSISFLQNVKLYAIRITTTSEPEKGPKSIKVFNDSNGIGFDEASGNEAAMELELSEEQLKGKELILTRYVKFQKANSIALFVADNQGGGDITRIDKLELFGSVENATASMTNLRNVEE